MTSIKSKATFDLSGALPCKSLLFGIFVFRLIFLFRLRSFMRVFRVFAFFQFVLAKEKIDRRYGNHHNQNHHRGNEINLGGSGVWHKSSLTHLPECEQRRKFQFEFEHLNTNLLLNFHINENRGGQSDCGKYFQARNFICCKKIARSTE